jgi:hypothetical protein
MSPFFAFGEPISLHRLCRNPFVAVHYSLMDRILAAAATSTREYPG